ncbi:MAG: AAA family ATPase [Lachnospiraceae bacterium]|nr:AAA family ATPase [Lachnospiraceae bacterium]
MEHRMEDYRKRGRFKPSFNGELPLGNDRYSLFGEDGLDLHIKGSISDDDDYDEEIERIAGADNLDELGRTYEKLSSSLLEVIKGQDQAVKKFVEGCFQGDLFKETEKGDHPRAYFFFFGPPGTGKTLLAETAAKALSIPYDRYDMSDFATEYSHEELIGTSKIYENAREGRLVDFVMKNPRCLLIFDEIEKAHINVTRLFLQILGSGYLRSKHSEKNISFKEAIVIFTSNAGKELYEDRSVNLTLLPERVLIDAIQREKNPRGEQVLPGEICSRIAAGNTILFNHLNIRHLTEMVEAGFNRVARSMHAEYRCDISYCKELPLLFLYNRGSEIDARIASGQSGNFLKKEIYELIRQLEKKKDRGRIDSISFDIAWDSVDPELKPLFENEGKTKVLIFADDEVLRELDPDTDRYEVFHADDVQKARELMKYDFAAAFIDPFFGNLGDNDRLLSIADYNTAGVSFFHELMEKGGGLPVYMIDVDPPFSEVDLRTFLQEGAAGVIRSSTDGEESMRDCFVRIMDEIYMEKQSLVFSGRGFVVDFKTRQNIDSEALSGQECVKVRVEYYALKKRMAVDIDSRGALLDEAERPNVRFDDVIGADSAKEELGYFIRFLTNPRDFLLNGNKAPGGVLLYGPPGTGKTMLARAMAGESDVSFIHTNASDFANRYVGESEENIRRVFRRARKYAPSIIFIDEIDAIGKQRTGDDPHREAMLNTLLTEMQGFTNSDPDRPVFVLAATNYGTGGQDSTKGIAQLDEALVRRFDNKIYVDLPNADERKIYIKKQLKKKRAVISDEIVDNIADRTPGESLAILQNIIDLAFRDAGRQNKDLDADLLLKALEDYKHGERKERSEEYYKRVAVHEMGHAYVSYICGDVPSYITIESRGDFGGYMQHGNSEDVPSYTKKELIGRIRTALAGRCAEELFYGEDTANNTGASSDLKTATDLAFSILGTYGMEKNRFVVLSKEEILRSSLAGEYVTKVNDLIAEEMNNTSAIIKDAKEIIKAAADELVKKNRMTGAEFTKLMEAHGVKPGK